MMAYSIAVIRQQSLERDLTLLTSYTLHRHDDVPMRNRTEKEKRFWFDMWTLLSHVRTGHCG